MAFDVTAAHRALAEQISTNVARPVTVYPFDPGPGGRSYPCIVVDPGEPYVEYHGTFGDNALAGLELSVKVMIAAAEIDQRIALADFVSDGPGALSSIRAAIETDATWAGTVARSCVMRCHAPQVVDDPDVLVAVFDVMADQHRGG
jgi:hypothetical protein